MLLQLLNNIASELRLLPDDATKAMSTLHELAGMEAPARQVWVVAGQRMTALGPIAATGEWDAMEEIARLAGVRDSLSSSLLDAVREARTFIRSLPEFLENVDCNPLLLAGIDAFARETTTTTPGPYSEFSHGLYWSEISMAGHDVLLFATAPSEHSWERDAKGLYAPHSIVRAEAALLKGEELSPMPVQPERAMLRAARLLKHARLLASKKLDHSAAAQWRFLEAARVAAKNGGSVLAAQAFAWLSHLLMQKGQHRQALDAANHSLAHADNPLAQYLRVTLSRSLGDLRTAGDVEAAETQLARIAGLLPSAQLEAKRASVYAEMVEWRLASERGGLQCLMQADAAKILLCLLGKLMLP
jgi:tetratricopeptide (TPR) repeat protein